MGCRAFWRSFYDTVRRLMPVTFRAVSLRRADEETTPGVHCFNEIAVKDKPSYGSIDFAARCGTSQLFEPPQTALIELKRLLARQRRQLVDDCAHIKNSSEYKEASSNVARKQILRLRFRPATAQSRSETQRRAAAETLSVSHVMVRTRTGFATLCCVGLAPFTRSMSAGA